MQVARSLIGCKLVRQFPNGLQARGIIVETEAYLDSGDEACHAARGRTPSNQMMFSKPGRLYVYPIHARHCMNVVTGPEGQGSAVLIRAVEFVEENAINSLIQNRLTDPKNRLPAGSQLDLARWLSSGPGRLCESAKIDRSHDGLDLLSSSQLWIESPQGEKHSYPILSSPRIGLSKASELPLRWFLDGHQLVSGPAKFHSKGRNWRFQQ